MLDGCGLEGDGWYDIEAVEQYWHGLTGIVPHTLDRLVCTPAGTTLPQGASITAPFGAGEVFAECDSGTIYARVTSGVFTAGELLQIAGVDYLIDNKTTATGYEVRVTTDQGGIDHLFYRSLTAPHPPVALAWKFSKPGLPAAPAVSPADAAAGMELRNFVLAPAELGWENVYGASAWINPIVDDDGDTWLLSYFTGTFAADRSAQITLKVFPCDAHILGETPISPMQFDTAWAAGTWPASLDTLGYTARWDWLGTKNNGRTYLFRLIGGANPTIQPGPAGGLGYLLGGIFEINISGTLATGLQCAVTVLKSKADCDWTTTVVDNTDVTTWDDPPDLPACPYLTERSGWSAASGSRTAHIVIEYERLIGAYYTAAGAVVYVSKHARNELDVAATSTGGYPLGEMGDPGEPCLIAPVAQTFTTSSTVTEALKLKLKSSAAATALLTVQRDTSETWAGAAPGYEIGTGSSAATYTINGAPQATITHTYSLPGLGGLMFGDWAVAMANKFDGQVVLPYGTVAYVEGVLVTGSLDYRFWRVGEDWPAPNMYSLLWARSVAQTSPIYTSPPWSGAAPPYDVADGAIVGILSPAGAHAGSTATTVSGAKGLWSPNPYFNYTLAWMNPRFGAYNPHTGAVATLRDHAVWFV